MYQKFTVRDIQVNESENTILITFTYDIDEDSVDDRSISVRETKDEQKPLVFDKILVQGHSVVLHYEDIKVNTEYQISVDKKILSIMGDELAYKFEKTLLITSDVDSSVEILSPANFEQVDSLTVKLKEQPGSTNKEKVNRYKIQIAFDHGFLNILHETVITDQETITLSDLKKSHQYFLRARAEKDDKSYGNWSNVVTFSLKGNEEKESETDPVDEDDDPVFEDDLEIIGYPENGITPKSFLIEFDKDLDTSLIDLDNFILTRKKV